MKILEPIEVINRRLKENYGLAIDGTPKWRVVWSHDEFEKRLISTTPEGFTLLTPYIEEVPKYRQWNDNRHVLEQYIILPNHLVDGETILTNKSYEPVWTFEDASGTIELPPKWEVIEFVIQTIYQNAAFQTGGAKYKESAESLGTKEAIEYQVERLEEELFGNETSVGDALAHDSAVGFGKRTRNTKVH